mgnify:FL=1
MFENQYVLYLLARNGECIVDGQNGKYLVLDMKTWYFGSIDELQAKIEEGKAQGCRFFKMASI